MTHFVISPMAVLKDWFPIQIPPIFSSQVNAIAAFIGHLFGNLAVTFSRMAATILGIPLPSKEVTF